MTAGSKNESTVLLQRLLLLSSLLSPSPGGIRVFSVSVPIQAVAGPTV